MAIHFDEKRATVVTAGFTAAYWGTKLYNNDFKLENLTESDVAVWLMFSALMFAISGPYRLRESRNS